MGIEEKVKTALENAGISLRLNTFTSELLVTLADGKEKPLSDLERAKINAALFDAGIKTGLNLIDGLLLLIADQSPFHPVKDYLNSLVWDGKPRVDTWLKTYFATDDTEYEREIGRIFLVAAVRRVRQPGCKYDECLVLRGPEGIGKSTALNILGGKWFADNLPLGADDKLTIEQTHGVWISESAELIGTTPAKVNTIKRWLGKTFDGPTRLAYKRTPENKLRQFVSVATTNEVAFLFSNTGDRRFWPVECRMADTEKLKTDRDQLWAEAAKLEKEGTSIRLDPKYWDLAKTVQQKYGVEDPWETKLKGMIQRGVELTLPNIWANLDIPSERQTPEHAKRIAVLMAKLGYKKERRMNGGLRTTTYSLPNVFDSENFDHRPETAPEEPEVEDEATLADQYAESELEDYE